MLPVHSITPWDNSYLCQSKIVNQKMSVWKLQKGSTTPSFWIPNLMMWKPVTLIWVNMSNFLNTYWWNCFVAFKSGSQYQILTCRNTSKRLMYWRTGPYLMMMIRTWLHSHTCSLHCSVPLCNFKIQFTLLITISVSCSGNFICHCFLCFTVSHDNNCFEDWHERIVLVFQHWKTVIMSTSHLNFTL